MATEKKVTVRGFTEAEYDTLLECAAARFRFLAFADMPAGAGIALWRHDIDISPHRALALARIEHRHGVLATYFVQLGSYFYNAFEKDIREILLEISRLGHEIGLHFDASLYAADQFAEINCKIKYEANVLAELIGNEIRVFSIHNPSVSSAPQLDEAIVSGLINASSPILRETFTYCSDSNGLWLYRPLQEIICDLSVQRLYALTHPCWWQADSMLPRQRMARCVEGRAINCLHYYDSLLNTHGRKNIG